MDKPEILNDAIANPALKPLRILILINLEWNPRLGAVRVYLELAEQWRAAGHLVEHFSLTEAFPGAHGSGAGFALRQVGFAQKAAAFVKRNASRFDVVDALIGSLSASKQELGFEGLLVARSVGLYRLYDRFEADANRRWPRRPRGKLLGRIFYRFTKQWLIRASDKAVAHADLINVPNEREANCVRAEIGPGKPVMVQPYGLSIQRRDALSQAAAPAATRLAGKKISFIGMWAERKGARDWAKFIRLIRKEIPDAQFSLLGTMVERETVFADLESDSLNGIELVSQYSDVDLPKLLSDCAVGAFPSYVEGFGLGVLEQLAAGIPTVAFDIAGPRDVLQNQLSELLAPVGDIAALADKICRILNLDLTSYDDLTKRSVDTTTGFDSASIARSTIDEYRKRLADQRRILFIQPFSLGFAGGGGARILRAMLEQAPLPWHSACCSPERPRPWPNETHLPNRPSWGKIERSRLAMFPKMTMPLFASRFRRRLKNLCKRQKAWAIHSIPHSGLDFAYAHAVARELEVPFFISVHDDLAYTAAHERGAEIHYSAMQHAWLDADARFVISDALGREYARRFGVRDYQIVTDGLTKLNSPRLLLFPDTLRIYFMGLFHLGYEQNFRAFLEGLRIFERQHPGVKTTVTCRCEYIRPHVWKDLKAVKILPYADETQIHRDMEDVDLLYMPMPFGEEHENFTRYSVSTKMVTYLGSGLPILYHGPTTSAAFELLNRHQAAILFTGLDSSQIAKSLGEIDRAMCDTVVRNALELARREFMLSDQTRKFWDTIGRCLSLK